MGQEISGYWDRYSYYQTDGGDIDLFLLNGPSVNEVLDRYTLLTGRPAMPTKQSLGYCASTMYYAELEKDCDQEIYKVIDKHRKRASCWITSGWPPATQRRGGQPPLCVQLEPPPLPRPKGFFDRMNEMGINRHPQPQARHPEKPPLYAADRAQRRLNQEPRRRRRLLRRWWGGEGRFFDFTNPAARATWKQLLEE